MSLTAEQRERAKAMYADGKSDSIIAGEFGVTRNAIIGLRHRGKWTVRGPSTTCLRNVGRIPGSKNKPRGEPSPAREAAPTSVVPAAAKRAGVVPQSPKPIETARIPSRVAVKTAPVAADPPPRLTITDLTERQCRWPVGENDQGQQLFCAAVKPARGAPYCAMHAAGAANPAATKRFHANG